MEEEAARLRTMNAEMRELARLRTMEEELKGKIECTICMEVPMKGPVPVCCNGHFTCSQCLAKREEDGHRNCATCKVPMGNSKSLLAAVVIENIEHKCDFKDCEKMVHFKEYKKHQKQCEHRIVRCPGTNCNKLLPFRRVLNHTKICWEIDANKPREQIRFDVHDDASAGIQTMSWNTCSIMQSFFFKMRKLNNLFSLEVVMVEHQKESEDYRAEISFLDLKSQPVLSFSFPPRPISLEEWGETCLTVTEKTLASIWRHSHEKKSNYFVVVVNINSNKEGGQGRAKKARVEKSEEENDDSGTKDEGEKSDVNSDIEEEGSDIKSDEAAQNDNINLSSDIDSNLGDENETNFEEEDIYPMADLSGSIDADDID